MPVLAVIENNYLQEFFVYLEDPESRQILHTCYLHYSLVSLAVAWVPIRDI